MRVRVVLGDLAEQRADVLVRSAPAALVARGPDRVLTAAGREVASHCRELHRAGGSVGAGQAVRTPAGRLQASWLVHVVAPTFTPREDRTYLLSRAYRSVLQVAEEVGAAEVALAPLGSCPPYWPLEQAAQVALYTLYATPTTVAQVRLVVSSAAALEVFAEALARR